MADLLKAENIGGGRTRKLFRDGDNLVVTTKTDASALVARNRRAYNDAPERFGDGLMHKVADFNADVLEATARKAGIPWAEFINVSSDRAAAAWAVLLNDRDTRAFRTRPGYVAVKAK